MKITQGYTLSQFVDYCETQTAIEMAISYMDIVKYNNFLKQPLSKDMFINGVEKVVIPDYITDYHQVELAHYSAEIKKWQEAEKKVIFENSKLGWCEEGLDVYEIDGFEILYNHHTKKWFTSDEERELTCLGDLFEATKGQLKLKNVEL